MEFHFGIRASISEWTATCGKVLIDISYYFRYGLRRVRLSKPMPQADMRLELSPQDLSEIEKHTYHVSNFMCALLNFVELLPPDLPPPVSERATMAVGLVERSRTHLCKLMEKLGQIRRRAGIQEENIKSGELAHEKTPSMSQSLQLQQSARTYR